MIKSLPLIPVVLLIGMSGSAQADHSWSLHRVFPRIFDPPPAQFYYDEFDEEDIDEDEIVVVPPRRTSIYVFDDEYYEPEYQPQRKVTAQKKPALKMQQPVASTKPQVKQKAPTVQKVAAKPEAKAISCDKGGQIVAGYGFSDVKPVGCSGKIFTFTAARANKKYEVRVSSTSGQLTEVKKVQ